MAKRSISKNFQKDEQLGEILEWVLNQLPTEEWNNGEMNFLKQKIRVTVDFDPDHKGSLIPEGPKISHHHARTRG